MPDRLRGLRTNNSTPYFNAYTSNICKNCSRVMNEKFHVPKLPVLIMYIFLFCISSLYILHILHVCLCQQNDMVIITPLIMLWERVYVMCLCFVCVCSRVFFIPCLLGCTNSGSIFSMVNLTFAHTKKQFQYALCISSLGICSLKSLIVPLHCLLCCKTVLIYTHNELFE